MRQKLKNLVVYLQQKNNNFIYNSIITVLEKYYEFILSHFDVKDSDYFLEQFIHMKEITNKDVSKIFDSFIAEKTLIEISEQPAAKGGVYFIYDVQGTLLYIGKSERSLKLRMVQSFIDKLPYGSHHIKTICPETKVLIHELESLSIKYYKPLLNQMFEKEVPMREELYYALFGRITKVLSEKQPIRITIMPMESTNDLFDNLDDCI
jgi:hypothetical protein